VKVLWSITNGCCDCTGAKARRCGGESANALRTGVYSRRIVVVGPNQRWALDFVSNALAWGRRIRLLAVIDVFTCECLAIEVDTPLPAERVCRVLDRIVAERGAPQEIQLDNGPELTSRVLDQWAYEQGTQLRFIEPGKPVQNAFLESFNPRLRDECLNEHWLVSLGDARRVVEAWRADYQSGTAT